MNQLKGLRDPPPHFIIPPGMAYAARCANGARKVRLTRESSLKVKAYREGFNNQSKDPRA